MYLTLRDEQRLTTQTTTIAEGNNSNTNVEEKLRRRNSLPPADNKLFHQHEITSAHNRPAPKAHTTSSLQGNPQTLTYSHQPRSGNRLNFGRIARRKTLPPSDGDG